MIARFVTYQAAATSFAQRELDREEVERRATHSSPCEGRQTDANGESLLHTLRSSIQR